MFVGPYNVTGLGAVTLNTTAMNLSWTRPLEYKDTYTYRVETTGCGSNNTTVNAGEVAVISGLTPGTNCTFCVYVRAADGTEGAAQCISQYTSKGFVFVPNNVQEQSLYSLMHSV